MPILPSPPTDYDEYESAPPVSIRILAGQQWAWLLNTPGSNGETDPMRAGLTHVLIGMSADANKPTEDARIRFFRALVSLGGGVIKTETNHGGTMYPHYHRMSELSVDYHPSLWLQEIAEIAGVSKVVWPMKTHSRLAKDHFYLAAGYRAKGKYLYPLPDGRVLVSNAALGVDPDWLCKACDAFGFPDGLYVADGNWRKWAEAHGIDPDSGAEAEVQTVAREAV